MPEEPQAPITWPAFADLHPFAPAEDADGLLRIVADLEAWLATIAAIDGVRFVPVDNEVAMESVKLPGEFHADPADRMITALARHYSASLVTADDRIRAYKHVKTIWD